MSIFLPSIFVTFHLKNRDILPIRSFPYHDARISSRSANQIFITDWRVTPKRLASLSRGKKVEKLGT